MAATRTCPECGMELTPGALEGLCPKCMGKVTFNISSSPDDGRETCRPQTNGPAPAQSQPTVAVRIIVQADDSRIATYTLQPGEYSIGRDPECRIRHNVAGPWAWNECATPAQFWKAYDARNR